jgi:hypothetical protein
MLVYHPISRYVKELPSPLCDVTEFVTVKLRLSAAAALAAIWTGYGG